MKQPRSRVARLSVGNTQGRWAGAGRQQGGWVVYSGSRAGELRQADNRVNQLRQAHRGVACCNSSWGSFRITPTQRAHCLHSIGIVCSSDHTVPGRSTRSNQSPCSGPCTITHPTNPATLCHPPPPPHSEPAPSLQVCTGVMLHGYPLIKKLCGGLQAFMQHHNFQSVAEFKGGWLGERGSGVGKLFVTEGCSACCCRGNANDWATHPTIRGPTARHPWLSSQKHHQPCLPPPKLPHDQHVTPRHSCSAPAPRRRFPALLHHPHRAGAHAAGGPGAAQEGAGGAGQG